PPDAPCAPPVVPAHRRAVTFRPARGLLGLPRWGGSPVFGRLAPWAAACQARGPRQSDGLDGRHYGTRRVGCKPPPPQRLMRGQRPSVPWLHSAVAPFVAQRYASQPTPRKPPS